MSPNKIVLFFWMLTLPLSVPRAISVSPVVPWTSALPPIAKKGPDRTVGSFCVLVRGPVAVLDDEASQTAHCVNSNDIEADAPPLQVAVALSTPSSASLIVMGNWKPLPFPR
jgi:hypothetical protein